MYVCKYIYIYTHKVKYPSSQQQTHATLLRLRIHQFCRPDVLGTFPQQVPWVPAMGHSRHRARRRSVLVREAPGFIQHHRVLSQQQRLGMPWIKFQEDGLVDFFGGLMINATISGPGCCQPCFRLPSIHFRY